VCLIRNLGEEEQVVAAKDAKKKIKKQNECAAALEGAVAARARDDLARLVAEGLVRCLCAEIREGRAPSSACPRSPSPRSSGPTAATPWSIRA
jgi:hypothetical protein